MSFFRPLTEPQEKKNETQHPLQNIIKHEYAHLYKYGHNSAYNPQYPKKKCEEDKKEQLKNRTRVTVIGLRTSKEFLYCYHLIKGLYKYRSKQFEAPVIRGVTELEWPILWNNLKIQYGSKISCVTSKVVVIVDDQFIGGENEFKKYVESKYIYHICLDYVNESIQQFASYIENSGRPCAYLHIAIDGKSIGTLIFMLYSDVVPRTCENFLRLCGTNRGGYGGTPVHRIVKDCWIQCGGFTLKENSDLGCENFLIPHDRRGVLCMSNAGRHVQCSTQFFVLLEPAPWMHHKYVAFGQLILGEKTLQEIENVPTWYESPTQDIMIYKTGVLNADCKYAPINKKTHEYIQNHIENLYDLGTRLIEELWERVSKKIKEILDTERDEESSADTIDINNEFDVEVYDYETFHYSGASSTTTLKPEIPYFLPTTDVPYPGEVNSEFNLKKILDGDYCYEADLETDIKKNQQKLKERRLSVPEDLVGALFECFEFKGADDEDEASSDTDSSSRTSKSSSMDKYLAEAMDHVSFAGPVIKTVANIPRKFEVFDVAKADEVMKRFLTDDELRIIRMAIKEYKFMREKKVSINLGSSKLSHTRIIRRPTGYIHMEDIVSLLEAGEQGEEAVQDLVAGRKEVRVFGAEHTKPRATMDFMPRESVLMRLLEDVAGDDTAPTLKDYKSSLPADDKPFYLLTFSDTKNLKMDDRGSPGPSFGNMMKPLENVLHKQHGEKIYRKLSSDYVATIGQYEDKRQVPTILESPMLRKRPWVSVEAYKLKNRQPSVEKK